MKLYIDQKYGLLQKVPDEPKGKYINTHKGTGLRPGVPDVSKADSLENDETNDVDDEEYRKINEEMYDDLNVELKDAELINEDKEDIEMDNSPRINRGTGRNNQRAFNVASARENVGTQVMDDTVDERDDQELEAHYMYMEQIQEVTPDAADNFGPIFDTEPLQNVQNDNDNYNVFANDREHSEQPESVNDTYLEEQGDTNITID
ncbi:hypothetical protein Tco_1537131 [Tanacetum coccineum]